ncbi:MAG: S-layer homology domain-containing protein [Armatimonadetes bacterium]|nr:S-layer homology domain-containing protein [Armatimonadota bacterium]
MMRFFFLVLVLSSFCSPLCAVPFSDVPSGHWAQDAVRSLAEKGLVQGYGDGRFNGNRDVSRYQMAHAVARLLERLEKNQGPDFSQYIVGKDIEILRKLVKDLRVELDALAVRTSRVEDVLSSLESRTSELERIHIRGDLRSRVDSSGITATDSVTSSALATGQLRLPDFTNYDSERVYNNIPLSGGSAMTGRMGIRVQASLSPSLDVVTAVAAHNTVGNQETAIFRGVTPPYLANPFQGYGGSNFRAVLDRVDLDVKPANMRATLGAYEPQQMGGYLFRGQPSLNASDESLYLPCYGVNFSGRFRGLIILPELEYELFGTALPDQTPYGTFAWGGHAGLTGGKWKLGINFLRALNDEGGRGVYSGVNLPGSAKDGAFWGVFWGGFPDTDGDLKINIGPQEQRMFGMDFSLDAGKSRKLHLLWSRSTYTPQVGTPGVEADMVGAGLSGAIATLNYEVEYLSVDPRYDPFTLQIPFVGNFPVLPSRDPYRISYSGYYSLHDVVKYPHNREGFRASLTYPFPKGTLRVGYSALQQKAPSLQTNIDTIGFVEPLWGFFAPITGTSVKGRIRELQVAWNHHWTERIASNILLNHTVLQRPTGDLNEWNLTQTLGKLVIGYDVTKKLQGRLELASYAQKGRVYRLTDNRDVGETAASLGLLYRFAPEQTVSLGYRMLKLRDNSTPAMVYGNLDGTHGFGELSVRF